MSLFIQMPKCERNTFKPKKVIERARIPQGRTREGAGCSHKTCFWGPASPLPPPSSSSCSSPRAASGFHGNRGDDTLAPEGLHWLDHQLSLPGLQSPPYSRICSARSNPTPHPSSCPPVNTETTQPRELQFHPDDNERSLQVTVEFDKKKEGSSINAQRSGLAPPVPERECTRLSSLSQLFVSSPEGKAFQFYLLSLTASFFLFIVLSFLLLNLT